MPRATSITDWIAGRRSRPLAKVTLFCFPHAGGGASSYFSWPDVLPDWIDVAAVQPPGRERRISEPAIDDLGMLVEAVIDEIGGAFETPYAFFGHSLGALVAFETARRLVRAGSTPPDLLVASGARAPHLRPEQAPLAGLSDEALAEELGRLGTVPEEVLAHEELWDLLRPTLRADLRCLEGYRFEDGTPLDVPVLALGGRDDPLVPLDTLMGWEQHTTAGCTVRTLPGDHFFVADRRMDVLDSIQRSLSQVVV